MEQGLQTGFPLIVAISVGRSASDAETRSTTKLDQIPSIAIEIPEYCRDAVRFMPWSFDEADTPLSKGEVVTREITATARSAAPL